MGNVTEQWIEEGIIDAEHREVVMQFISSVYDDGREDGREDGYDSGWSDGFETGKAELEAGLRDEWFQQGWEAALIEHGIEE